MHEAESRAGVFEIDEQGPDGMVPPAVDEDDPSLKRTFSNWLFGQESNTVALYLILGAIFYGGYQGVTVWIPAHLVQIQKGYETISDKNREVHKEISDRTHEDIKALSENFEKALERSDKSFQLGLDVGKKRSVGSGSE